MKTTLSLALAAFIALSPFLVMAQEIPAKPTVSLEPTKEQKAQALAAKKKFVTARMVSAQLVACQANMQFLVTNTNIVNIFGTMYEEKATYEKNIAFQKRLIADFQKIEKLLLVPRFVFARAGLNPQMAVNQEQADLVMNHRMLDYTASQQKNPTALTNFYRAVVSYVKNCSKGAPVLVGMFFEMPKEKAEPDVKPAPAPKEEPKPKP